MTVATALMPIPGFIDPVPSPVPLAPRRWTRGADRAVEGRDPRGIGGRRLEPKHGEARAKQLWHWVYNPASAIAPAMTDVAKVQQPWFADVSSSRGPR